MYAATGVWGGAQIGPYSMRPDSKYREGKAYLEECAHPEIRITSARADALQSSRGEQEAPGR